MVTRHRKHRIMHAAVEHNGLIFVGGHAASDISLGMKEQTQQVCAKLDDVLAECGSDKTQLVSARIYISDMSKKEEMNEAGSNGWMGTTFLPAPPLASRIWATRSD